MASDGKHHLHWASACGIVTSPRLFLAAQRGPLAVHLQARSLAGKVQWQSRARTSCTKEFRGFGHQDAVQGGLSTVRLQAGISMVLAP